MEFFGGKIMRKFFEKYYLFKSSSVTRNLKIFFLSWEKIWITILAKNKSSAEEVKQKKAH